MEPLPLVGHGKEPPTFRADGKRHSVRELHRELVVEIAEQGFRVDVEGERPVVLVNIEPLFGSCQALADEPRDPHTSLEIPISIVGRSCLKTSAPECLFHRLQHLPAVGIVFSRLRHPPDSEQYGVKGWLTGLRFPAVDGRVTEGIAAVRRDLERRAVER